MDVADMPLCDGDSVVVDMSRFGLANVRARGLVQNIVHGFAMIRWDDDAVIPRDWNRGSSRLHREYIVAIDAGLAPTVPPPYLPARPSLA